MAGLKGFARVYELASDMTLYDFHKMLRFELEFPQDQLIQFKGLDAGGELVARYGLFDLGKGAVDDVTFWDTVAAGIVTFVYFYDVTSRKSVLINFEGEVESVPEKACPVLVESKGPNPIEFENGYVAYEDRPADQKETFDKDWDKEDDDFDFDDDDEDEEPEDEDGKEIYDESEASL